VTNLPDLTEAWNLENRIGAIEAHALFDRLNAQLRGQGYFARGGQIIDATLVLAPKQHVSREERVLIDEKAMPASWESAKRRQQDTDGAWGEKHSESYFGCTLSVNAGRRHKLIYKIEMDTASVHGGQHFDAVLDQTNTRSDVYAAPGYPSQRLELNSTANGYRAQIQRRGSSKGKFSECHQKRNHRIARVRSNRAWLCSDRAGGRQIDCNDRAGPRRIWDDDDGTLLQHQLLPP